VCLALRIVAMMTIESSGKNAVKELHGHFARFRQNTDRRRRLAPLRLGESKAGRKQEVICDRSPKRLHRAKPHAT
jgi:hypothetical protein